MASFPESMQVFKRQLENGDIQQAYQGLMAYFRTLRAHFKQNFPDFAVPSNIYYGYLDMTYFAVIPPFLNQRKLKVAIVFVYDTFRFEVWLSGANREVQVAFWTRIKESGWDRFKLSLDPKKGDSILEQILVEDPDFEDLDALSQTIDQGTSEFIHALEAYFTQSMAP